MVKWVSFDEMKIAACEKAIRSLGSRKTDGLAGGLPLRHRTDGPIANSPQPIAHSP